MRPYLVLWWCLFLLFTGVAEAAPADRYVLRLASPFLMSDLHQEITSLEGFDLKEETQGRFSVLQYKVKDKQQDETLIRLIEQDEVDAAVVKLSNLVELAPKFNLLLTPYLFDSYEVAYKVIDDYLKEWMNQELEPKGLTVIANFIFGFRAVTTSDLELTEPEHFAGLKCVISDVPQYAYTLQALDAKTEYYEDEQAFLADLAAGKIVCQEATLSQIRMKHICHHHKKLMLTNHLLDFRPWIVTKKFLASLPAEYRELLLKSARKAELTNRELLARSEQEYLRDLTGEGMQVVEPRLTPFVQRMKPAYSALNRMSGGQNELFRLLYKVGKVRYGL